MFDDTLKSTRCRLSWVVAALQGVSAGMCCTNYCQFSLPLFAVTDSTTICNLLTLRFTSSRDQLLFRPVSCTRCPAMSRVSGGIVSAPVHLPPGHIAVPGLAQQQGHERRDRANNSHIPFKSFCILFPFISLVLYKRGGFSRCGRTLHDPSCRIQPLTCCFIFSVCRVTKRSPIVQPNISQRNISGFR